MPINEVVGRAELAPSYQLSLVFFEKGNILAGRCSWGVCKRPTTVYGIMLRLLVRSSQRHELIRLSDQSWLMCYHHNRQGVMLHVHIWGMAGAKIEERGRIRRGCIHPVAVERFGEIDRQRTFSFSCRE